ncbi:TATA-box-binding protein [Natrinema salsiterrestre]|uniref:Transcription factor n=1 Tax=Natrinema salsiterrestre TaxID=2950540 RepID=A0A9Q4Q2G9_9EURY|nr:transcription factor [Natrinema salsiterrestre]MDF9748304.1 transcription factor [Natrinema salsiterrestre]
MVETTVVNVIGTITYQQEIALGALADTLSQRNEITSVTYEPAENHWLQTRFAPDNTYVAFYRSGRCSIVGSNSVDHIYEIADCVNTVIRDILDFNYEPKVEISNIVATADIGSSIHLETLALELGMNHVEYEPEQFPALMYRGENYTALIFASGKVLCTGLTKMEETTKAVEDLASRLKGVK